MKGFYGVKEKEKANLLAKQQPSQQRRKIYFGIHPILFIQETHQKLPNGIERARHLEYEKLYLKSPSLLKIQQTSHPLHTPDRERATD